MKKLLTIIGVFAILAVAPQKRTEASTAKPNNNHELMLEDVTSCRIYNEEGELIGYCKDCDCAELLKVVWKED